MCYLPLRYVTLLRLHQSANLVRNSQVIIVWVRLMQSARDSLSRRLLKGVFSFVHSLNNFGTF